MQDDSDQKSRYFFKGSARHASRLVSVQLLYQKEQTDDPLNMIFADFFDSAQSVTPKRLDKLFVKQLVEETLNHKGEWDNAILPNLAHHQSLDHLPILLKIILRLALTEKICINTPKAVVLNEYIEITKDYLEDSAASFVNGILSTLFKEK